MEIKINSYGLLNLIMEIIRSKTKVCNLCVFISINLKLNAFLKSLAELPLNYASKKLEFNKFFFLHDK
jgi:hypothetical protein